MLSFFFPGCDSQYSNYTSGLSREKLDFFLNYQSIKHCGMRILDIQNLQLSHDNFDISINDLDLENAV